MFARHGRLRHRPLFDRPHRAAVGPVEHVEKRRLVRLHHRADALSVHGDLAKHRRPDVVPVPQIVMDGLEVPHALARLDVECDQRIREQVVARPPTAVPRGRGRRQRDVDVTELFIGRHRIPRAEVAGDFPRTVAPRVVAELAGLRHHVKRPQQPAGFGVEAADVFGRRFLACCRRHRRHPCFRSRRRRCRARGGRCCR